jgi:hypothetical protein
MFLNKDVDHVSILIHGPPEIVARPLDVHEELIQVPDVAETTLPSPELSGVEWAELPTPLPDGLVGDYGSSLRQEFLHVPEARRESMVQPNGVTDDLGRKSVSAVASFMGLHQPSLPYTDSS